MPTEQRASPISHPEQTLAPPSGAPLSTKLMLSAQPEESYHCDLFPVKCSSHTKGTGHTSGCCHIEHPFKITTGNCFITDPQGVPGGSAVKNLPAMQEFQETQFPSLGQKDPLEEGMAAHSSVLAWKSPRTEEPGGLQSMGLHRVRHN